MVMSLCKECYRSCLQNFGPLVSVRHVDVTVHLPYKVAFAPDIFDLLSELVFKIQRNIYVTTF